ncbi:MAG: TraR/DksA C4-type zinc finger protein [Planctomycetota bacterium]|jgi:RNA polymerase-binding transcription factor DksA|nr:TraR/DksA C4-type zinc finger protein [Planctomycetota bacterium]
MIKAQKKELEATPANNTAEGKPPKAGAAEKKAPAAKAGSEAKKPTPAKTAASPKPAAKAAEKKAPAAGGAKAAEAKADSRQEAAKPVQPPPSPPPLPPPSPSPKPAAIKVSSGKPGLSVAPGCKFLNRPVAAKSEPAPHQPDRRLFAKELGDIKADLTERRERLLIGINRELSMQRERSESKAADDVDKATDAYDEDLSFEIATTTSQQLEEIQTALEKIEKGTYGECEICGCVIAPARLKTLPFATTCRACQMQEEEIRRRDDGAPSFSIIGGDEGAEGEAEPM